MERFLFHWIVVAVALGLTAWLLPGVRVDSALALAVASLVLGFVNAVVRPVLILLTLPITIVTLGLFLLVVNGLAFLLAAAVVPGFEVAGFWWGVLGALIVSVISSLLGRPGLREEMR